MLSEIYIPLLVLPWCNLTLFLRLLKFRSHLDSNDDDYLGGDDDYFGGDDDYRCGDDDHLGGDDHSLGGVMIISVE